MMRRYGFKTACRQNRVVACFDLLYMQLGRVGINGLDRDVVVEELPIVLQCIIREINNSQFRLACALRRVVAKLAPFKAYRC